MADKQLVLMRKEKTRMVARMLRMGAAGAKQTTGFRQRAAILQEASALAKEQLRLSAQEELHAKLAAQQLSQQQYIEAMRAELLAQAAERTALAEQQAEERARLSTEAQWRERAQEQAKQAEERARVLAVAAAAEAARPAQGRLVCQQDAQDATSAVRRGDRHLFHPALRRWQRGCWWLGTGGHGTGVGRRGRIDGGSDVEHVRRTL